MSPSGVILRVWLVMRISKATLEDGKENGVVK